MTMKIDKPGKPLPASPAGENAARAPARGAGQPPSAPVSSSTSVSLGSAAAKLNSLEGSIQSSPVVDANKVAEIKQAISDGHFKVNSGVVADQLINTVRDLIARGN
ncbi:MAG: flagellar biosynthesis anti-sigma factor FlgM [Gallionella sp.]